MAFALTGFQMFGGRQSDPIAQAGPHQYILLNVTGDAADVDLDIGDLGGTFWTDAVADASYGSLATGALAMITDYYAQWAGCGAISSPQLIDRVQVAALTGAGQYTLVLNATTNLPEIAFDVADGDTSYVILLDVLMSSASIKPIYYN